MADEYLATLDFHVAVVLKVVKFSVLELAQDLVSGHASDRPQVFHRVLTTFGRELLAVD